MAEKDTEIKSKLLWWKYLNIKAKSCSITQEIVGKTFSKRPCILDDGWGVASTGAAKKRWVRTQRDLKGAELETRERSGENEEVRFLIWKRTTRKGWVEQSIAHRMWLRLYRYSTPAHIVSLQSVFMKRVSRLAAFHIDFDYFSVIGDGTRRSIEKTARIH